MKKLILIPLLFTSCSGMGVRIETTSYRAEEEKTSRALVSAVENLVAYEKVPDEQKAVMLKEIIINREPEALPTSPYENPLMKQVEISAYEKAMQLKNAVNNK